MLIDNPKMDFLKENLSYFLEKDIFISNNRNIKIRAKKGTIYRINKHFLLELLRESFIRKIKTHFHFLASFICYIFIV